MDKKFWWHCTVVDTVDTEEPLGALRALDLSVVSEWASGMRNILHSLGKRGIAAAKCSRVRSKIDTTQT